MMSNIVSHMISGPTELYEHLIRESHNRDTEDRYETHIDRELCIVSDREVSDQYRIG